MKKLYHLQVVLIALIAISLGCKVAVRTFSTKIATNIGVEMGFRKGVIFTADYPILHLALPGVDPSKRFTPTKKDIEETNSIFREQVIGSGKAHLNHYENYPVGINLNKYFMQYVGFINARGEKVIHINYVWKERDVDYFNSEYLNINDGGNHYWQLNINLSAHKVINLWVNGMG